MLDEKLIKEAKEVRENAYAPYSRFKVGAAIFILGRMWRTAHMG